MKRVIVPEQEAGLLTNSETGIIIREEKLLTNSETGITHGREGPTLRNRNYTQGERRPLCAEVSPKERRALCAEVSPKESSLRRVFLHTHRVYTTGTYPGTHHCYTPGYTTCIRAVGRHIHLQTVLEGGIYTTLRYNPGIASLTHPEV